MQLRHPVDFKTNHNGWWYKQHATYRYGTIYHPGIDYNLGYGNYDLGQPVYTITGGEVVFVEIGDSYNGGWGQHVIIKHNIPGVGIVYSHYAHLQNVRVKKGDIVQYGQQIAEIGKTGTVWAHLHHEIIKEWTWVKYYKNNPRFYPWEKIGFTEAHIDSMYYHPIEFINNHNQMDDMQKYVDYCKEQSWLVDNTDIHRPITRAEVCKIIALAHGFQE